MVHRVLLTSPIQMAFLAKLEIPIAAPFIVPHTSQAPSACGKLVVQYDDDEGFKHFWVWDFMNNTVAALVAKDYQSTGRETVRRYS